MSPDEARSLLTDLLGHIAPEVDLDTVDPDAMIQDEVDLDSMDFLNLVTAVYEATGVEIPERDYPAVASVSGWVAYLSAIPTR
jgi:acyl carrier protein